MGLFSKLFGNNMNSQIENATIGNTVQALETIEILLNTSNLTIVEQRVFFLKEQLTSLQQVTHFDNYQKVITAASAHYQKLYYDKKLTEFHINVVTQPKAVLDSWDNFVDVTVQNIFFRYLEKEAKEMEKLVRDSAIAKRIETHIDNAYKIRKLLSNDTLKETFVGKVKGYKY